MSHAPSLKPTQVRADQAAVDAIAHETSTSTDVVKALYDEEFAALAAQATIKQFVGVIVTRRVKQQLRHPAHRRHVGRDEESA
jgi:Protein of unknown function (DUF3562)